VLIALLAVLGVNLVVVVVLAAGMLSRRRWVSHQAGSFAGIAHLTKGDVDPLGKRPRRGYGRWVGDVLVWTPAPLFLRNSFAPIDHVEAVRPSSRKVRRLGNTPCAVTLASGAARIEITVRDDVQHRVTAPFGDSEVNSPGGASEQAGFDGSLHHSSRPEGPRSTV
jgi:hypothetical protein